MLKVFILSFISWSFCLHAAVGGKTVVNLANQESKVEFLAVGKPTILKIRGTGGSAKGKLESDNGTISGEIIVPILPMTTGVGLRDEHMKSKYLESEKYPDAVLSISDLKLAEDPFSKSMSLKAVPFHGKLKIHGMEKEVSGTLDIDSDASKISIMAKTKTTISAHNIAVPTYLGIKVADEVEIFADLKIKK